MANREPVILAVAPTGAYRTKQDHPRLPVTIAEIADCAAACLEAGASLIQLHVRDLKGQHLLDPAAYREATGAIRRAVRDRLVVQITTEAAERYGPADQMALVREARPEAATVSLAELIPNPGYETEAQRFFEWLFRERVIVQFVVRDADGLRQYQDCRKRGVIPPAPHLVLFVVGSRAEPAVPRLLAPLVAALDNETPWAACAFGPDEHAATLAAAALGGHVRVGFEHNLHLKDGSLAPDNAALVWQARAGIEALGRGLLDADGIRERFIG
ncbi:MAG: 3-keto-5-aminohexanoate cleavage protein [Burkholderiales bacterium]